MSRTINAERVFARAQIIAANARYTEADGRAIGEVKTEHLLAGIVLVKDTGAYNELESCGMIEPLMAQLRSQSTINPRDLDDLVLEMGFQFKQYRRAHVEHGQRPLPAIRVLGPVRVALGVDGVERRLRRGVDRRRVLRVRLGLDGEQPSRVSSYGRPRQRG